jgi:hypothetical protein
LASLLKLLIRGLGVSFNGEVIVIVGVSGESGSGSGGDGLVGVRCCSKILSASSSSSSDEDEMIMVQSPSSMQISLVGRPAKFADGNMSTGMS